MAIDNIIKNADDLTEVIARMDKSQRDLFYKMMVERYPNLASDMTVTFQFALEDHHRSKK